MNPIWYLFLGLLFLGCSTSENKLNLKAINSASDVSRDKLESLDVTTTSPEQYYSTFLKAFSLLNLDQIPQDPTKTTLSLEMADQIKNLDWEIASLVIKLREGYSLKSSDMKQGFCFFFLSQTHPEPLTLSDFSPSEIQKRFYSNRQPMEFSSCLDKIKGIVASHKVELHPGFLGL